MLCGWDTDTVCVGDRRERLGVGFCGKCEEVLQIGACQ